MPLIDNALNLPHIRVRRRWRSCVICGNRTKSLKRVGFSGNPLFGWVPWVVCGERCDTLARLLPETKLADRVHTIIFRPPMGDYIEIRRPETPQ